MIAMFRRGVMAGAGPPQAGCSPSGGRERSELGGHIHINPP